MTVIISEVEGPVVNGDFCLATEAHDDDGLPHTLEHLIFLGSEQYPYKGVLDLLANRCLASGTNAWTDTDHTCYTVTTAGSEGFLSLLPIYLDHILYPTLTDSAFMTEVYHISGEGRDVGVVYTEMQGRENTGESRVNLALLRAMYPGHCGYKSETGGVMKNLRESTSNSKVRAYHKQFYRPENLTVIIVGHVRPEQVLKALIPGVVGDFVRPWQSPVPPLMSSVELSVPYPSDEEVNGMVYVGWRGPSAVNDLYSLTACSILLKYLTDTSVSPLPKEFVDIPDPYASKVCYSIVENSESLLMVQFENVPVEKLNSVKNKLNDVLSGILSAKEPFDMNRLSTVINRHRLECLSYLENAPHDSIAYIAIGHMLYGNSIGDLNQRLNQVAELERMEKEPPEFWEELLRKYMVEGSSVMVKGVPSIEEQLKMAKEEEERVKTRCEKLGPEGLKKKETELMEASLKNETPPPDEMLTCVPIPNINNIHFHTVNCFSTYSAQQDPRFNMEQVPVYMQLDHLQTNFVYLFVLMDSSDVNRNLRPYFPLLMECLLESPLERDGVLVPYQDVIAQLEEDTIVTATRFGLESNSRFHCGPFSHTVSLMLQLEPKKFEKGINWIRELLYQTKLTIERVKIIATKIVNHVAEIKRKGDKMVHDLMRDFLYNKDSNHYATSVLRQYKFLTAMLESLEDEAKAPDVLSDLEALREVITRPQNMVVHMVANLDILSKLYPDPAKVWSNLLPKNIIPTRGKLKVVPDWSLMKGAEENPSKSCVAGIGSVESNFLCQTTPCLKDFQDPDLAPLLVFFQYLTQLEGPLWKQLRGQGLAYSYNILPRPHEGLLYFTLYRAGDVVGAYKEAKSVIEARLNQNLPWDQTLFDCAKSSLIYEIIHREKTIGDVVAQSLLSYFKGVDHNYNKKLVQLIAKVQLSDLNRIGPKYVAPMFDSKVSKTTVVCHPTKVDEVVKGLNGLGLNLVGYSSLEESSLNEW
ncbi:hypothetical protein AAG570_001605 [Ranatra chinensis]|uniref:Presequence protease, mitochondrial n=1 Tax=Ranatra chinensis TaxID=642074 RepID=A0ABD0Y9V3_9HEMI